ncbi:hypothetical protein M0802_011917 [Mischocyttarus mexicanus]|nr:hypothetical protein M0802_011917 [Mischocyttarus mexicanus]
MSDENLEICPFNPLHLIPKHEMFAHVTICRSNYSGTETKPCPYNSKHLILVSLYEDHLTVCENRASYEEASKQRYLDLYKELVPRISKMKLSDTSSSTTKFSWSSEKQSAEDLVANKGFFRACVPLTEKFQKLEVEDTVDPFSSSDDKPSRSIDNEADTMPFRKRAYNLSAKSITRASLCNLPFRKKIYNAPNTGLFSPPSTASLPSGKTAYVLTKDTLTLNNNFPFFKRKLVIITVESVAQPSTSTVIKQPSKSKIIAQPSTSTVIKQSSTSTIIAQPSTLTVIKQPSTSTIIAQPSTSTIIKQPLPSTSMFLKLSPMLESFEQIAKRNATRKRRRPSAESNKTTEEKQSKIVETTASTLPTFNPKRQSSIAFYREQPRYQSEESSSSSSKSSSSQEENDNIIIRKHCKDK